MPFLPSKVTPYHSVQPYDSLMELTNCPINRYQTPTTDSPLTITFTTLRRSINKRRAVFAVFPSKNDLKRRAATDHRMVGPSSKACPARVTRIDLRHGRKTPLCSTRNLAARALYILRSSHDDVMMLIDSRWQVRVDPS